MKKLLIILTLISLYSCEIKPSEYSLMRNECTHRITVGGFGGGVEYVKNVKYIDGGISYLRVVDDKWKKGRLNGTFIIEEL